jgi:flagellar biosynthetic protein FlhB
MHGMPSLSWSRVAPKLSKLSPVSGAKRLFGKQALVEFAKTLVKLAVVVTVAVMVLKPHLAALGATVAIAPAELGNVAGGLVVALVKAVAIPVGALALFDLIYQRRTWWSKLKMSLQELKDEHKDSEGDPKIKAKIRQIAMQRSRRRMMAAVPQATVIITNPTHYAVALKYDHGTMNAPVVVAKGVDALALRIRAVATDAGVPLVENRPLARALYASAEIDRPIPTDHYAAVAEIIGYVMRLARERRA